MNRETVYKLLREADAPGGLCSDVYLEFKSVKWVEHFAALVLASQPEQQAAVATLEHMGYTYHGGERWKPPLVSQPADPMDWPLPCDVTVGHGTMRKGVALRTLVLRMKSLYEMATGENADEVAGRSLEERNAMLAALQSDAMAGEPGWQSIESVPQDMASRLYKVNGFCVQGFVDSTGQLCAQNDKHAWRKMHGTPTHWMPLPTPPKATK